MWQNGDNKLLKKINNAYKSMVNGGMKIGIVVGTIILAIFSIVLLIFVKDKEIIQMVIGLVLAWYLFVGLIWLISSKKFIEVRYKKVVIAALNIYRGGSEGHLRYKYSYKDEEDNIKEAEAFINNRDCEGKIGYLMECKTKKKIYTYVALEEDILKLKI